MQGASVGLEIDVAMTAGSSSSLFFFTSEKGEVYILTRVDSFLVLHMKCTRRACFGSHPVVHWSRFFRSPLEPLERIDVRSILEPVPETEAS